ncbi:retrovirus-related pol polyprotein from transposon TNT 1-94 [Tanacetum coccineum]
MIIDGTKVHPLEQEELHQFDRPKGLGTSRTNIWQMLIQPKVVMKELKNDEDQTVFRNKARLVAKGYALEEGIDFEESFAPVVLGSSSEFLVAHGVRCDPDHPEKVLLLRKRSLLYGLKQAPRAG